MSQKQGSGANGWTVASAIIVGVAAVASTYVLGTSLVRTKGADEVIRVTGSARMDIRSDLVVWDSTVQYEAPTVAGAYASVKGAVDKVETFLKKSGVADNELTLKSVEIKPLYQQVSGNENQQSADTYRTIQAYKVSQVIEVRSSNVDGIGKVIGAANDLVAGGLGYSSQAPEYLYTKIADAKVQILSKAAEDARHRADEIAKSSGGTLGNVRFAHMSPLQITTRDDMAISGEGTNDTTAIDKSITAIVQMGFSVH